MLGFRAAGRVDRCIEKDGKLYNALDFKKFYPKDQRSYTVRPCSNPSF